MVWFNVDDGFPMSRKVLSIPRARRAAAVGVWTLAGAWSTRNLTDGRIPRFALDEIPSGLKYAPDLVTAQLWDETESGWVFRNWPRYQRSKEDVLAERADNAARQQAYRDRKKAERNAVRNALRNGGDNALVTPSVTGPTPHHTSPHLTTPVLPTEVLFENPSSPAAPTMPCHDDFIAFWELYPRKVGKIGAEKAYKKAIKKVGVQKVAAGLQRLITDPNLPTDRKLIPHAATWLNDGRWDDEPYPVDLPKTNGYIRAVPTFYPARPGQMAREM